MRRLLVLAVVCSSASARADYIPIAPVKPLTLIDTAGLTMVGFDSQYTKWSEPLPGGGEADVSVLTFDIVADFRLAPHWMLSARLPIGKASVDGDPARDGCCDLALGNFTVGGKGLWSARLGEGTMAVMGGDLAIAAPTASDAGDRGASAVEAAFSRFPHDPSRYLPNTTAIRFQLPLQLYSRWWMVQADAGLQLFIYDSDVADSADLVLRVAIGAGIRATYKIAILVEVNDVEVLTGDGTSTSIDVGLRYGGRLGLFGARLYLPIDGTRRDLDMLGIGIDAGLRF